MHRDKLGRIRNFVCIISVFVLTVGIWAIDVSVGAMITGHQLTTGWMQINPMQNYHIGLLLVMCAGLILGVNGLNGE